MKGVITTQLPSRIRMEAEIFGGDQFWGLPKSAPMGWRITGLKLDIGLAVVECVKSSTINSHNALVSGETIHGESGDT